VDPHVQLLYVLPRSAHNILPEKLRKDIEVDKKCNDMKNEYKWAFCRYFWEAHVILD
jgi:5'-3' exonuclease